MKFDHILFPVDFSQRGRALNKQVELLAARFDSRVTLMHVFEIPASWYGASEASLINTDCFNALRDSAAERLSEYVLNVPETRIKRVLVESDVAGEIVNWACDHDVDLIVMGTHGYGALQGWILGSVTAKVLHNADIPIWTASPAHAHAGHTAPSKILCAVEIMDEAVPLLRFAGELAEKFDATVQLIHSVPELNARPERYLDFDLHRYLVESARVEIAKLQREAATTFPLLISRLGIGEAVEETATALKTDLVVIGRGKQHVTFGRFRTHAYDIIRHAPCPVLSYSLTQQDRISSSCTVEHLSRPAEGAQLQTDSH